MRFTMKDIEEAIGFYSSKASDYCHQLGIAGIVIIWAIYSQYQQFNQCQFKILMLVALFLFVMSIFLSLVHYFHLALITDRYYHQKETYFSKKGINNIVDLREKLVEEPPHLESKSWFYFKLKAIVLLIGYLAIFSFTIVNMIIL